ncbi:MAG: hypothetical protein PHI31_12575 [Desulfuromonadaceae bacterium]|nr:hypothetical protein [Desulfuromonadaceae bacterium]
MMTATALLFVVMVAAAEPQPHAEDSWYTGDERCPPPANDGRYSDPYTVPDCRQEYPTFPGADKVGWSCSYQRDDGVIVQYGDSRTPQQQWLAVCGDQLND